MLLMRSKKMAVLGVMAAFSTVLLVLGTVISVNTVFFTALASFLAGIAVVLYGIKYGLLFYFVCAGLDFLFNPNKIHVFLYLAIAGYLLLSEGTFLLLKKISKMQKKERIHRGIRFFIFMCIYIPILLFLPGLFLPEQYIQYRLFYPVAVFAGVLVWILFDFAYGLCKKFLWRHNGNILSSMK